MTNAERQRRHRARIAEKVRKADRRAAYLGSGQRLDWGTPPDVFDPLHTEFGFTLDVCASPWNAKCERFFTVEEDGLSQSWGTETVWLNPPYGPPIGFWMQKAAASAEHGATVVCLVPARTDVQWWHAYVSGREIRFLKGRVAFLLPEGRGTNLAIITVTPVRK